MRFKDKKKSIKQQMLEITLLPIVLLGVLIIVFGFVLTYSFYSDSVHDELAATTNMMLNCLELTVRGDYRYEEGMLSKGDINITDSTMLYRIKEKAEIDTTIFWMDERILTTMQSKSGVSAVGTKADQDVVRHVLERGEDYFSNNIEVAGEKYIGYYTPLQNSSHEIVGMIFAGKKKSLVYWTIAKVIMWFGLFSGVMVVLAVKISRKYSAGMISDIGAINRYLKDISEEHFGARLEERIGSRRDEIGEIGVSAIKMRKSLQFLIEMDPLTSLYNRRGCNRKLKVLMDGPDAFSLVMCDIDFFKKINDQYGHDAGDYVLERISGILRQSVEGCGFASRWGGEEFLVAYTCPLAEAVAKLEAVRQAIRECRFFYAGEDIHVTMTFGIQERGAEAEYEELIKKADEKLYVGKNGGRNRIVK